MRSSRVVVSGMMVVLGLGVAAKDAGANAGSLFQKIKDKETLMGPVPPETSHTLIGTMDCDYNGSFKLESFPTSSAYVAVGGLYKFDSRLNVNQHVTTYQVGAFAKHVHLRLAAINRKGRQLSASLLWGSSSSAARCPKTMATCSTQEKELVDPKKASGNDDFVDFDVGESSGRFNFAVQCGKAISTGPPLSNDGQVFTGYVDKAHCTAENLYCHCPPTNPLCAVSQEVHYFNHSHYWADGGAFQVEVIPVAVIYQPPADKEKKSYAKYTDSTTVGSSTTFTYSSSSSDKHSATPPMDDVNQASSEMGTASKGLIATGNPYAMAAGAVLGFIASGLGSTTATETTGSSKTNSTGLSTRFTQMASTKTGTGADLRGPGDGDYIHFYQGAYFAWEAEAGPVHSVFLGAHYLIAYQVWQFKADLAELKGKDATAVGSITKLHKKSIDALLKLDPFAYDTSPNLPSDRFRDATAQVAANSDVLCHDLTRDYKLKVQQGYTAGDTSASFTTETTQWSPGFLAFLGWGIQEDKTIETTVGVSRAHNSYEVDKSIYEVHLASSAGDTWCTKIYFDKLFGTFAFKQVKGH